MQAKLAATNQEVFKLAATNQSVGNKLVAGQIDKQFSSPSQKRKIKYLNSETLF